MTEKPGEITNLSRVDVTLDAVPAASGASSGSLAEHGPVALVEGGRSSLTVETETLLRKRLRLAAGTLFLGSLVFLPQHYVRADFSVPGEVLLFTLHCLTTLALGALGILLYHRRQMSIAQLRFVELTMFGLIAAFFVALEHFMLLLQCRDLALIRASVELPHPHCKIPVGMWLLLVFTYSLFVPNTWRRASLVIAALAVTPIATAVVMTRFHPEVKEAITLGVMYDFSLIMAVAAVAAVFGVDTIGSLRRQAFEARQLGQYRLKRRIGAGGMGEVHLAEHQLLKRPCVIKIIRPDKAGDPKVLARFQREVQATAKLSHWNTVEIFDYGSTEDGTFYYVMEYLPGMSLAELVERFGPLPSGRVVYLLRQACEALAEAHQAGLIHRDIKPGNIFAAQRGGLHDVAKLLDFGLVKSTSDDEPAHLTMEGSITGSPLFMSPEQATGDSEPDARSDVYSLGAVAYFLLTGRPPFEGNRPIKVIIAHAQQEVTPPSVRGVEVPADLERIVMRCLAKKPADRFQGVDELADALASCGAAADWSRRHAADWWRQQRQ